jgi:hypothetical protein
MNINYASQNAGVVAWDGTAAYPVHIRNYNNFAYSFHATADIVADAVFEVQAAPASAGDPCLPGTFADVPEILTCVAAFVPAVPDTKTTITIPAGTKKGQQCSAAIPCRSGAFLQLKVGSGDTAKVQAVAVLNGPH